MSKEKVRHFIEDLECNLKEEFLIWKENGGLDITLKGIHVSYQETHNLSTNSEDEDFLNSFKWYINYCFDGESYSVRSIDRAINNNITQLDYLSGSGISAKIIDNILDRHTG